MLIDFHTHCFPDRLAERAIGKLKLDSGNLAPCTDGTVASLRESMRRGGVDRSAVMNIATNPRQMHAVNDFAASINGGDLIAFGSVHPDAPDALAELERIAALGLPGVKFHPEYQGFYPDEERMRPIYRKISEFSLITLFHAGGDIGFASPWRAMPEQMARALTWFESPVVAAHWGGAYVSREVLASLCGLPIYFDTSFGYGVLPRPQALRILEKHGCDRVLFATDTPWHSPEMELAYLDSLGLSAAEREKITHENAENLLSGRGEGKA